MRRTETLTTADGVRVSLGVYGDDVVETAVIICPGFFQSKETAAFRQVSQALAGDDQDVLCMDFRGHGASSGLFTFSAREEAELETVLAWARARYRRIVVMGFSLGGAIAINTLSRRRNGVAGLIAVSAPAAFEDIECQFWTPEAIRTGLRGLGHGSGCRPGNPFLKKPRPVDQIARLEGLPLLFIHGTQDVIVGVGHSRRLFGAAREPKQLEIIDGGSHAEALFLDDPPGFIGLVKPWVDRTLSGG